MKNSPFLGVLKVFGYMAAFALAVLVPLLSIAVPFVVAVAKARK